MVRQADDEALRREDTAALDVHLVAGGPGGVVRGQIQIGQHLAGQQFWNKKKWKKMKNQENCQII